VPLSVPSLRALLSSFFRTDRPCCSIKQSNMWNRA
jgi:hypothetical protein